MDWCLFQWEILLEEEYRKFPGQRKENPLKEAHMCKGLSCQEGGNIQEEMMMIIEGHIENRDPLRGGDIQTEVGDSLTKEDTLIEDLLEEDIPIEMEDPLMDMEDPWWWRDLLVMEDPLDLLVNKDHQALKDPLENTFDSVGQSMLQLARAQDQTNRQLQQHIQQV